MFKVTSSVVAINGFDTDCMGLLSLVHIYRSFPWFASQLCSGPCLLPRCSCRPHGGHFDGVFYSVSPAVLVPTGLSLLVETDRCRCILSKIVGHFSFCMAVRHRWVILDTTQLTSKKRVTFVVVVTLSFLRPRCKPCPSFSDLYNCMHPPFSVLRPWFISLRSLFPMELRCIREPRTFFPGFFSGIVDRRTLDYVCGATNLLTLSSLH